MEEEESFFTLPTPPRRRAPSPAGTLDGFDDVADLPPPLRFDRNRSPAAAAARRRDETPMGGEPDPGLLGAGVGDEDEGLIARLLRRWMDERAAPEVLPHCEDDIAQCLFLLHEQVRIALSKAGLISADVSAGGDTCRSGRHRSVGSPALHARPAGDGAGQVARQVDRAMSNSEGASAALPTSLFGTFGTRQRAVSCLS